MPPKKAPAVPSAATCVHSPRQGQPPRPRNLPSRSPWAFALGLALLTGCSGHEEPPATEPRSALLIGAWHCTAGMAVRRFFLDADGSAVIHERPPGQFEIAPSARGVWTNDDKGLVIQVEQQFQPVPVRWQRDIAQRLQEQGRFVQAAELEREGGMWVATGETDYRNHILKWRRSAPSESLSLQDWVLATDGDKSVKEPRTEWSCEPYVMPSGGWHEEQLAAASTFEVSPMPGAISKRRSPTRNRRGFDHPGGCWPNFSRHKRMPTRTPDSVGALAASCWQLS